MDNIEKLDIELERLNNKIRELIKIHGFKENLKTTEEVDINLSSPLSTKIDRLRYMNDLLENINIKTPEG